jgi:hypothetical protein
MNKIAVTVLMVLTLAVPVAVAQPRASLLPELCRETYLFEVIRHLYRWHLDENDAEKIVGKPKIAFWVRDCTPKLDPGDQSQFGEIIIPALEIKVTVKKADYVISEIGLTVRDDTFKIINVARSGVADNSEGYKVVHFSYTAIRDYGHRTRMQARFPDEALLVRLRQAARVRIQEHWAEREAAGLKPGRRSLAELRQEDQVLHLAPLSEVASEVWLFWETGRMLIHFASDIDIENPAIWDHDELAVELFDIDEQTVVSLDEVAGSNAYITRDQVGRTLFNCIVLGRRLIVPHGAK